MIVNTYLAPNKIARNGERRRDRSVARFFASSAEFVGTDLRRIYASDSLLGIKLRSIGQKFWVSKNLLGCGYV
ncbi:MAG: hypothetical protein ACREYE_10090, partial [Gammaproteobacteria bacterium]